MRQMRGQDLREDFDVEPIQEEPPTKEAAVDEQDYGPITEEHAPGPPGDEGVQVPTSMTIRQLFNIYFKKPSGRRYRSYHIQFKRAMDKYGDKGVAVAMEELRQLHEFRTFTGVKIKELSKEARRKIICSSLFFKEKFFADGTFEKLKARLVAGGHMQDRNLYDDLSSPTVNLSSVFLLSCLAAKDGSHVMSVDITGAYLNAELDSEVMMRLNKPIADLLIRVDGNYKQFQNED
jgi:hypothetical protein